MGQPLDQFVKVRSFPMALVPPNLFRDPVLRPHPANAFFANSVRSIAVLVTCLGCWGWSPSVATGRSVSTTPRLLAQTDISSENGEPDPTQLPALSVGDTSEAVELLQRWLKETGFYTGDITGRFDTATDRAVAAFQEQQGLPVDGVVGMQTWERLAATRSTVSDPENGSPDANTQAEQPDNKSEKTEKTDEDSGWGNWLFWGGGLLGLLGVAGLLFFLILKVFREDVEYEVEEEGDGEPEVSAPLTDDVPPSHDFGNSQSLEMAASEDERDEGESQEDASHVKAENGYIEPPPATAIPPRELPSNAIETQAPVEAVTRLPRMSIVEALIRDLHHPDPQRRHKAIWELGERGDSRAIRPLVDLLSDSDSQQRSMILSVLSEIGTRTLRPMKQALMLSLQDDSAEVRKNAIRDLTRIYDSIAQMSQLLRYGTDDPDAEVRETAKWALLQLQRIRTVLPSDDRTDDS
ncbi:MAG: peptidoglycan-binding protein [Cyanobacteria bacterium SID2]|nr:peptidoglycan-binding protein [Cyanobacteria bacterium SID2]